MKKLTAMLLALVLILSMAACGASAPAPTEAPKAPEAPVVENTAAEPAVKESQTFTAVYSSDHQTDLNETSALMGILEEKTGVHIDWTIVTSANKTEQLQLLLAGDKLPDMFLGDACIDTAKYYQEGILWDITDMIPEYMPNYMAMLEEYPTMMDMTRQADGRIYSLPRITPYYQTGGAMYINTEWLAQMNKEMPTTTEELYEILCAFRDNDMNGNGDPNDEIPFTWANARPDYGTASFMGMFGEEAAGVAKGTSLGDLSISDEGEVYFNQVTDGWKDGTAWLAKLYKEKLIDPEVFTQDEATFNAKSMGETMTYGCFVGWRIGQIVGDANADKYAIVGTLKHSDNEPSWGMLSANHGLAFYPAMGQFTTVMSEEEVITMLKYFDILFDPWYGEQVRRGTVPELMSYDEATKQFAMQPTPSEYSSSTEWQRSRAIQFLPYASSLSYQEGFKTTPSVIQLYAKDDVYGDIITQKALPFFVMEAEDTAIIDVIRSDLELYMNEKFALWVTGAEDVETGWDAYLEQCDKLGLQTWIDIAQDYVDELAD